MGNDLKQSGVEALIGKIMAEAKAETGVLLHKASDEAHEITQAARHKARVQVHEVIEGLRVREKRELAHELARFETERRQWRQSDEIEALAEGLAHLQPALAALWAEKPSREGWCRNVLAVAKKRLPAKGWRGTCPATLAKAELDELLADIEAHTGEMPDCSKDQALSAGLAICAGKACVDGTIETLLADKERASARLLAVLLASSEEGRA